MQRLGETRRRNDGAAAKCTHARTASLAATSRDSTQDSTQTSALPRFAAASAIAHSTGVRIKPPPPSTLTCEASGFRDWMHGRRGERGERTPLGRQP